VIWLLNPNRALEQRSTQAGTTSLQSAWRDCGPILRHALKFTALICVVGFFHPGLAPLIAAKTLGESPQDLGLFTSVLAAGSIAGGIVLQRNSHRFSRLPAMTLGCFGLITALAQLGMASSKAIGWVLAMAFLIGAGTAGLLSAANLITQIGTPQVIRGRMAGLSQIAFLGGGGMSGLIAAMIASTLGLQATFATAGGVGLLLASWEIWRRGGTVLPEVGTTVPKLQ
jgi:MFS family permease